MSTDDEPETCRKCGGDLPSIGPHLCPTGTDAAREEARRIVEAWEPKHGVQHLCDNRCHGRLALIDAIAAALGERDNHAFALSADLTRADMEMGAALADLRERCVEACLNDDTPKEAWRMAEIIRQIPLRRGDPRG